MLKHILHEPKTKGLKKAIQWVWVISVYLLVSLKQNKTQQKAAEQTTLAKTQSRAKALKFYTRKCSEDEKPPDKDKAIEAYTKCIDEAKKCLNFTENPMSREKLCKQIGIGYNERGFMKYRKVDFDEAIADYSKALTYDPSLYFTLYNRGLIHYRLGRFDEAISDMLEALSIMPEFQPAQQCLKQARTDKQEEIDKEKIKAKECKEEEVVDDSKDS